MAARNYFKQIRHELTARAEQKEMLLTLKGNGLKLNSAEDADTKKENEEEENSDDKTGSDGESEGEGNDMGIAAEPESDQEVSEETLATYTSPLRRFSQTNNMTQITGTFDEIQEKKSKCHLDVSLDRIINLRAGAPSAILDQMQGGIADSEYVVDASVKSLLRVNPGCGGKKAKKRETPQPTPNSSHEYQSTTLLEKQTRQTSKFYAVKIANVIARREQQHRNGPVLAKPGIDDDAVYVDPVAEYGANQVEDNTQQEVEGIVNPQNAIKDITDLRSDDGISFALMAKFCSALRYRFPQITGFTNPIYTEFGVMSASFVRGNMVKGYVQILQVSRDIGHWAVISNLRLKKPNWVGYYDSNDSTTLPIEVQHWIAQIHMNAGFEGSDVHIQRFNVTDQGNHSTCGHHAIMNAIALCLLKSEPKKMPKWTTTEAIKEYLVKCYRTRGFEARDCPRRKFF